MEIYNVNSNNNNNNSSDRDSNKVTKQRGCEIVRRKLSLQKGQGPEI